MTTTDQLVVIVDPKPRGTGRTPARNLRWLHRGESADGSVTVYGPVVQNPDTGYWYPTGKARNRSVHPDHIQEIPT